jgi:hypothetical protein
LKRELENLIEGKIKVLTEDKVETREKRKTGDRRDESKER